MPRIVVGIGARDYIANSARRCSARIAGPSHRGPGAHREECLERESHVHSLEVMAAYIAVMTVRIRPQALSIRREKHGTSRGLFVVRCGESPDAPAGRRRGERRSARTAGRASAAHPLGARLELASSSRSPAPSRRHRRCSCDQGPHALLYSITLWNTGIQCSHVL